MKTITLNISEDVYKELKKRLYIAGLIDSRCNTLVENTMVKIIEAIESGETEKTLKYK